MFTWIRHIPSLHDCIAMYTVVYIRDLYTGNDYNYFDLIHSKMEINFVFTSSGAHVQFPFQLGRPGNLGWVVIILLV